jgi:hypothetical protein
VSTGHSFEPSGGGGKAAVAVEEARDRIISGREAVYFCVLSSLRRCMTGVDQSPAVHPLIEANPQSSDPRNHE